MNNSSIMPARQPFSSETEWNGNIWSLSRLDQDVEDMMPDTFQTKVLMTKIPFRDLCKSINKCYFSILCVRVCVHRLPSVTSFQSNVLWKLKLGTVEEKQQGNLSSVQKGNSSHIKVTEYVCHRGSVRIQLQDTETERTVQVVRHWNRRFLIPWQTLILNWRCKHDVIEAELH